MVKSVTVGSKAILLIVLWVARYSFIGMNLFDMFTVERFPDSCVTAAGAGIVCNAFLLVSRSCHPDSGRCRGTCSTQG